MSSISLGTNIGALRAQRQLDSSTAKVAKSLEQLSSGLRINNASDDAASLAIADRLRSDSGLFLTAHRNINDAISMVNIIESTLDAQSNILNRLSELAEQSANGVYTATQRKALNNEYQALVKEFGRLGDSTTFNGRNLLLGNRPNQTEMIQIQAGITGDSTSQISLNTTDSGTLSGTIDAYYADFIYLAANSDTTIDVLSKDYYGQLSRQTTTLGKEVLVAIVENSNSDGVNFIVYAMGSDVGQPSKEWVAQRGWVEATFGASDALWTFDNSAGAYKLTSSVSISLGSLGNLNLDPTGLRINQAGYIDGDYPTWPVVDARTFAPTLQTTSIDMTGVDNVTMALSALQVVHNRRSVISQALGGLGANGSRLLTAQNLVSASRENYLAAESRLRDVDIAEASAKFISAQILQRTSAAILSQAQRTPEIVLSLLSNV